MEITNENGTLFGKLCGGPYIKDSTADVNGNYARLKFHSDADLQNRGFSMTFSAFLLPGKYKSWLVASFL